MSVDPLLNFQGSLRNQVSRRLENGADSRHSFLDFLLAMDNYYNVGPTRFTVLEGQDTVAGESLQIDFRMSLPQVQGIASRTGALAVQQLPVQKNHNMVSGRQIISSYAGVENVKKHDINRFAKSPPSVEGAKYVKELGDSLADGIIVALDAHMFPDTNVSTSSGNADEDRILAFAYPLQAATSGIYEYAGLNLAASTPVNYQNLQAKVKTAFGAPSMSSIRVQLTQPIINRGGRPDFGIVDSTAYDAIAAIAEGKVVIVQQKNLEFGGTTVRLNNINWMVHERMDLLSTREIYVGDSSTWEFRSWGMRDGVDFVKMANSPGMMALQVYFEAWFACRLPRYNARGVTVS